MGVHPGCPVCLIIAASLVAVETDLEETISAAKVAFVCGLWSVGSCCAPFYRPFKHENSVCWDALLICKFLVTDIVLILSETG